MLTTPNLHAAWNPIFSLIHWHRSPPLCQKEPSRRDAGGAETKRRSSRGGSAGQRGGERGGCNDGNRREQRECISHPPLCALLSSISLSWYIRLNCIYAEECSRMIYVREFNTVAHTVRCCYRISRLPQRMTIIMTAGNDVVSSSFIFFFFRIFRWTRYHAKFTRGCQEIFPKICPTAILKPEESKFLRG